jgi:hypothetical protein
VTPSAAALLLLVALLLFPFFPALPLLLAGRNWSESNFWKQFQGAAS